jgi:4-carboxymuconolactone decarboxylase
MPMSQQERAAADARVRSALGVLRKGTQPDAPAMPPRPGSAAAVTASTKLPIDDEVYAIQQYGYGEIWGRPGLKLTERSFLTLGVLAATAQSDQLAIHVNNALNLGITPDEICETLLHVGVYAGGSIWHNASNVVRYVFVERGVLAPGSGARPAANSPTTREQRQTLAEQVRRALGPGRIGLDDDAPSLRPLPGAVALTSIDTLPVEDDIAQIQLEYEYGEVWSRSALGLRTRAVITVAVMQALRLNGELHAHVNIALNLGVTPDELHEVFAHAGVYSGLAGWRNATNVAGDVFIQRGLLKARTDSGQCVGVPLSGTDSSGPNELRHTFATPEFGRE